MNWTVSRRIASGFALLLALIVVMTLIGVWALRTTAAAYDTALATERERFITAVDARGGLRIANVSYLRYMLDPDAHHIADFDSSAATTQRMMAQLRTDEADSRSSEVWRASGDIADRWFASARQGMAAERAGNAAEALRVRREVAQPLRDEAERKFDEGIALVQQRTDSLIAEAQSRAGREKNVLWAGLILALIVGVASALMLNRAISAPLQETSTVLATSAAEIAASTTEQAAGATESLAAVTQTAATVDEVVQTAEQAAERARAVAQSSQRAAEIGREGRQAVDESVATMDEVRGQVESIAQRILALAEQAQAIGEIISTVTDLAEQTNLLALNAAIEAARAGEQGRGFAVVATEVRSLAEQSKAATVRVRDILGQVQRATSAAVMATEEGSKQVVEGTRQVNEAGKRIRALSEAVADSAQAAAQIAASAGQQSTGMAQIRQAIANIQQAAQQNLAATRETERASQELNRMSRTLLGLVGGKLKETVS